MASPRRIPWRFRGRAIESDAGETVLSALLERGVSVLQRSIRYHRPRGPFCGVGFCSQCLLRVNGEPNVRACRYVPSPGDEVETENAWPSPANDLLGLLDLLFGHGIDTLHGFLRPGFARPLYERVVRRLAGYGSPPTPAHRPPTPPGTTSSTRFLVVGAGPAGRRAAERLAESGARVLLLDRGEMPDPPAGVEVHPRTDAFFLPPPLGGEAFPFRLLAREADGRSRIVRAERVVVATGAYDASLWFSGNDRPGVLTAEGALALGFAKGRPLFRRAAVVGGGARAALLLDRFGTHVDSVIAPGPISAEVARRASDLGIPLYPRSLLLAARGRHRVREVLLAPRGGGAPSSLPADAVLIAHRRFPHAQLFFQAGARMQWRRGGAAYFPELDATAATTVPGLFAAGEVAGFPDGAPAEASGIAAAEAALGQPAPIERIPSRVSAEAPSELEGYYRELLPRLDRSGKIVLCPCEDVLLDELESASRSGFRGIEVIKRYTGLGTGLCQGRYCLPDALIVLSILEGRAPPEVGYVTQRPPVLPVPLRTLAGLALEPAAEGGEA